MSRPPDDMCRMSEALSVVMDDIGVNEKLVKIRRESVLLLEAVKTIRYKRLNNSTAFIFGSQSEGSTTSGLESDIDYVYPSLIVNFVQHLREWQPGPTNVTYVLMIQNENIPPGYCFIQHIRSDKRKLKSAKSMTSSIGNFAIDQEGRVLEKNSVDLCRYSDLLQQHGPAWTLERAGYHSRDIVPCSYCKSSPLQATSWLQKLAESKWPSEDEKTLCRNAGCFGVFVGSKLSDMPEMEFRISTSLQERCLMFSLNITQLRCYVLMKMILKTHIHPYVEDVLSSFMCKNVLLYCVYNSSHESSQKWHTGNLLSYLHLCLFMLKECILQRNCPHLMIPENNLLTGCMTDAQRAKLLDIIDNLMEDKQWVLCKIRIDDLGHRLLIKLNKVPFSPVLRSATTIATNISGYMLIAIAGAHCIYILMFLMMSYNESLEVSPTVYTTPEHPEEIGAYQQN